ncbi:hypothetical protein DLJ49_01070 [Rhodovulum sp. 12E13]|uniref:hypothetical protein n=1 Tax=Rhodovulum sp. 12E13 TaxID=2203891 RepID=UPI000E1A7500|nr:hypothetical protein [Rhodovulum sp. 12E13]RDC75372.1 hypothetical protein DLJ49_01070 [Rhodovulum sp. 12E13]
MAGAPGDTLPGIDARFWQAVVAGAFLAMGWLVNGWQNRRERRALRAERLRDAHRALFAQIRAYPLQLVSHEDLGRYGDEMVDRMRADPGPVPLVPRERADRGFVALIPEIHILPRVTIDPVVTHYTHLHAIEALADDMRAEGVAALGQERRIALYEDYIRMRGLARDYGEVRLAVIESYASDGKTAAEAEARRLSSPGAARSAP